MMSGRRWPHMSQAYWKILDRKLSTNGVKASLLAAAIWLTREISGGPVPCTRRSYNVDGNGRRMEEGVVDEAFFNSAAEASHVAGASRLRDSDGNVKRTQADRLPGLFRLNAYRETVRRQAPEFEILNRIISRARRQRSKHQFRRSHASVAASSLGRLIAEHLVAAGIRFKLHTIEISDSSFNHVCFRRQCRCGSTQKVTARTTVSRIHARLHPLE